MIWIYIFIAIVVITLGTWIWIIATKRADEAPSWFMYIISILMVVSLVFLMVAGINQLDSSSSNEQNIETYDTLMLYYDVVDKSNDELLRWDYYQRVQEWNNRYTNYLVGRNSIWCSAFYGAHDFDNCDFINLELRRG